MKTLRPLILALGIVGGLFIAISLTPVRSQAVVRAPRSVEAKNNCTIQLVKLEKFTPTLLAKTTDSLVEFECSPCCNEAQAIYNTCMRMRDKTTCDCIGFAYYNCTVEHGGCGPCQCCADWIRTGEGAGCWENEAEARRTAKSIKQ